MREVSNQHSELFATIEAGIRSTGDTPVGSKARYLARAAVREVEKQLVELSPTPDRDRTTLGDTGAGGPMPHHNPPAAASYEMVPINDPGEDERWAYLVPEADLDGLFEQLEAVRQDRDHLDRQLAEAQRLLRQHRLLLDPHLGADERRVVFAQDEAQPSSDPPPGFISSYYAQGCGPRIWVDPDKCGAGGRGNDASDGGRMNFLRFIVVSLLVGARIWTPRRGNEWLRSKASNQESRPE